MPVSHFLIAPALAAVLLLFPASISAQTSNGDEGDTGHSEPGGNEPDGEVGDASPGSGAAPASTASIVASLNAATSFCAKAGSDGYAVDCIAERLEVLSNSLKGQDGFEEIHAILEKTSNDLHDIARANRSKTVRPAHIALSDDAATVTSRRLIAVDEARADHAVAQAIEVIGEAETLLLRSAERSNERALQYQQIAAALGSNKVLLRSS